jgi:branched-chain amino acid transport system permease protein
MELKALINAIVAGLTTGSLYAAMALGLTLVGGVVRILTFAHGAIAVMGGYFSWFFFKQAGLGIVPALMAAAAVMFIFGVLLYYWGINPLIKKPGWGMSTVIFTLGLSIIINNLLLQAFGPRFKYIPKFVKGSFKYGYLRIPWHDIILICIVILFFILFLVFLKFTWFGRSIRAVSEDMDGARIVGIDVDKTYALTFGIGMAVAGFSGALLSTKLFITPTIEADWMMKAFVIIILGGWGSVMGALLAAILLGVIEALTMLYLSSMWVYPVWAGLFLFILLLRPQGLLGGRAAESFND